MSRKLKITRKYFDKVIKLLICNVKEKLNKRKYRTMFENLLKDARKKVKAPYKEISIYKNFYARKTRKNMKEESFLRKRLNFLN